jgi:hypothetical protein
VTLRSSGSPDAPGVATAISEHARAAGVTLETFEARIREKTMPKHMPKMAEIADAAVLTCTCGEIAD